MKEVKNLPKDTTIDPSLQKKDWKHKRDEERQLVTGIIKNYECPGGCVEFVFRKWKGDPIEKFSFIDGQVVKIPLGVARHLNTNCYYPVHALSQDKDGKPSYKVGRKIRRYGFQSLEFLDENDLGSYGSAETSLVTIERAMVPSIV